MEFLISALCNEDANGNVPLGKSCNRYWQCQGGYPRLQRCPAMLVFDRRSLRCVVPPTEDCDIPTTPTPIDGDLQTNNNQQGGQLVYFIFFYPNHEISNILTLFIFCVGFRMTNTYHQYKLKTLLVVTKIK